MDKFTPKDKELVNWQQLELLGNVSEGDLWDAINDWLANMKGSEFQNLIKPEINPS